VRGVGRAGVGVACVVGSFTVLFAHPVAGVLVDDVLDLWAVVIWPDQKPLRCGAHLLVCFEGDGDAGGAPLLPALAEKLDGVGN
jgi:hypothetical protein